MSTKKATTLWIVSRMNALERVAKGLAEMRDASCQDTKTSLYYHTKYLAKVREINHFYHLLRERKADKS